MSSPRVQLRFEDDPPPVRTASVVVEGTSDPSDEHGARACVRHGRPRVGVQRPVDDLGDPMRRRVEHVLVGGPAGRLVLVRGESGHRDPPRIRVPGGAGCATAARARFGRRRRRSGRPLAGARCRSGTPMPVAAPGRGPRAPAGIVGCGHGVKAVVAEVYTPAPARRNCVGECSAGGFGPLSAGIRAPRFRDTTTGPRRHSAWFLKRWDRPAECMVDRGWRSGAALASFAPFATLGEFTSRRSCPGTWQGRMPGRSARSKRHPAERRLADRRSVQGGARGSDWEKEE